MKDKANILIVDIKLFLVFVVMLIIVGVAYIFSDNLNQYIGNYIVLSLVGASIFIAKFKEIHVEESVIEDIKTKKSEIIFAKSPTRSLYIYEKINKSLSVLVFLGLIIFDIWVYSYFPVIPLEGQIIKKEAELISVQESIAEQKSLINTGVAE